VRVSQLHAFQARQKGDGSIDRCVAADINTQSYTCEALNVSEPTANFHTVWVDRTHPPVSAILLAGGRSSRFGSSKAFVQVGGVSLLQWMVNLLASVCDEVIVVGAHGRPLPDAASVKPLRLVYDEVPEAGPMGGLHAGFQAARHELILTAPVDAPGLQTVLLDWLLHQIWDEDEAVVPVVAGRAQVLQAVYRRSAALHASDELLQEDRLRVLDLVEALNARFVEEPQIRVHDPGLLSFSPANTPEEMAALLARLGQPE
jgi:molybdopterin-guanine dinucleotide biosynthesis protein A